MKKNILFCICLLFSVFLFSQDRPIQNKKNNYSNVPMKIMGFTYKTTLSDIQKQLDAWDISYNLMSFHMGITLKDITWVNIHFDWINFLMNENGYLKSIFAHVSQNQDEKTIEKSFTSIVKDLPFRTQRESDDYDSLFLDWIYNGKDSSECAVLCKCYLKVSKKTEIYYYFYFNNNIPTMYR